ncbi:MAG: hypothetical protein LBC27_03960 [Spirochaetaceae bacterium]|jgi:hypothetical protein|nr:hypothetical protein [Spirochaetaceae bacterium]
MKNKPLLIVFFFFLPLRFVVSLDFTVQGGADYSSYPTNSEEAVGNTFKPEIIPLAYAELKDDFAVMYNYKINLGNDTIWRNMISGDVGYYFGHVDIGLGFFIGTGDFTFDYIDIGFSGRAGFEFPGVFLINGGFASSLYKDGPASRQLFYARAGFWLPHILITGGFELKTYSDKVTEDLSIEYGRTKYTGAMEFFSKNIPYRIQFLFGMQTLTRVMSEPKEEASFKSFIAGFRFYSQMSNTFAWFIEGSVPFNIDNIRDIKIFYNASLGLIFSHPES